MSTEAADRYRQRITETADSYGRRGLTVDPAEIDRAVTLALEWADVAARHGVTVDDLALCADLALNAFDAVRAADRRRARE